MPVIYPRVTGCYSTAVNHSGEPANYRPHHFRLHRQLFAGCRAPVSIARGGLRDPLHLQDCFRHFFESSRLLLATQFHLVDQRGDPVSLSSLHGRVVALTFLDPVCTSDCPLIAQELRLTDQMLGTSAGPVEMVAVVATLTSTSLPSTVVVSWPS